jgi:hypothetical protein
MGMGKEKEGVGAYIGVFPPRTDQLLQVGSEVVAGVAKLNVFFPVGLPRADENML